MHFERCWHLEWLSWQVAKRCSPPPRFQRDEEKVSFQLEYNQVMLTSKVDKTDKRWQMFARDMKPYVRARPRFRECWPGIVSRALGLAGPSWAVLKKHNTTTKSKKSIKLEGKPHGEDDAERERERKRERDIYIYIHVNKSRPAKIYAVVRPHVFHLGQH